MKKFLIGLLILLIFAGFVFYRGLISPAVPAGEWGVLESKLKGIEETPVEGGVWTWKWRWDKVFPTVVTVHLFSLDPFKADLETPITGDILPSGKDYASILGDNVDFSYEFFYYIEFALRPSRLPGLVKAGITPDKLDSWSVEKSRKVAEVISQFILRKPDVLFQPDYVDQIKAAVEPLPEMTDIEITTLVPRKLKIPDYELYQFAKEKYLLYQEEQFKTRLEQMRKERERNTLALEKEMEIIANIQDYGKLLEDYPVLLEFLNMRNMSIEDFVKLTQSRIENRNTEE